MKIDPSSYNMTKQHLLSVNNFHGTPPIGAIESAFIFCEYEIVIRNGLPALPIDVECSLLQNKSWINWSLEQLKDESVLRNLLIHEEGHFKLCILFAKRYKRDIGVVELDKPEYEVSRIIEIKHRLHQELEKENSKYEAETRNGRELIIQERWNNKLDKLIKELESVTITISFK